MEKDMLVRMLQVQGELHNRTNPTALGELLNNAAQRIEEQQAREQKVREIINEDRCNYDPCWMVLEELHEVYK